MLVCIPVHCWKACIQLSVNASWPWGFMKTNLMCQQQFKCLIYYGYSEIEGSLIMQQLVQILIFVLPRLLDIKVLCNFYNLECYESYP